MIVVIVKEAGAGQVRRCVAFPHWNSRRRLDWSRATSRFDWYRSADDPNLWILIEIFRDRESGDAHVARRTTSRRPRSSCHAGSPPPPRFSTWRFPAKAGLKWGRHRFRMAATAPRRGGAAPVDVHAAVDADHLARDVTAAVGAQEGAGRGDVAGCRPFRAGPWVRPRRRRENRRPLRRPGPSGCRPGWVEWC